MNHDRIAFRIQSHIDADPWSITVYQPGDQPGIDNEVRYTFTGRIYPAGTQGRAYYHAGRLMDGSAGTGDYVWLLLAPKDTRLPKTNATLRAVHGESNLEIYFQVLFSMQQPSHQQVLMKEIQG